ncbi:MAG: hypothetical protein ABI488_16765 [Polyangiaceae bacterium]
MRTSVFLVGLCLGAGAVGCGSSDAGGGSAGASGSSAQAGASGSAGATSASAGSSSAGSSSAGSSASGATAMGSVACQKYCACHDMNCASTAIPGGKSCADFCAAMTPEQLACRQNMCSLVPAQPDNDHCTHSVGIMQCICDGTPGSC